MFLITLSECGPSAVLKVLLFLKEILDIIFIIVPIGLIIMVSIDFAKAVIASDSDNMKKVSSIAIKRLLYAVILFAIPWIVSAFITLLGGLGVDSVSCLTTVDIDTIKVLEADEKAREEIEKAAREQAGQEKLSRIQQEAQAKEIVQRTSPKASGCDGVIYYENGTFYKPSSSLKSKNGTKDTKGSAENGYNKYFYDDLSKFVAAGKQAGYTISPSKTLNGAWRPYEQQQYYYCCYNGTGAKFTNPYTGDVCKGAKTCNNGNLAAVPGTSNHGWGIASDLKYGNNAAIQWAHANASKYNLRFSVASENWHIEPLSVSINDEKVKKCL